MKSYKGKGNQEDVTETNVSDTRRIGKASPPRLETEGKTVGFPCGSVEKEVMRIVIAGHVDHGKSTLIGRLLYDTNSLPEGKLEQIMEICEKQGKGIEFAYVMDALEEEQEQNITIDTTQIFFKTLKRDYVIIDAPGHKEFLKNMVTGASYAEAAILIVDVKEGVKEQTKRHAYILSLLGIRQVIVVINKMDLIKYDQQRFSHVKNNIVKFLDELEIMPSYVIPISAAHGDNVAKKSDNIEWYDGPTILKALDSFSKLKDIENLSLRFPVQDVYKFDDKRIIVGRIESGTIRVGDSIVFLPSQKSTKVRSIEKYGKVLQKSFAGECIGITTEDEVFVERGEIITHESEKSIVTQSFKSNVFWMGHDSLKVGKKYLLKIVTEEIESTVVSINKRIDSSTLETIEENTKELLNAEVGELIIRIKKPIAIDLFHVVPTTGRFVLVDHNRVAGGGIITEIVYETVVVKDLRGAQCPFTLEHAKPLIEHIRKGQIVEILVTNLPAVETIGKLAFEHNLEFNFKREDDYIKLTVKSP